MSGGECLLNADGGTIVRNGPEHRALLAAGATEYQKEVSGGKTGDFIGPFIIATPDEPPRPDKSSEGGPDMSDYFVDGYRKWRNRGGEGDAWA